RPPSRPRRPPSRPRRRPAAPTTLPARPHGPRAPTPARPAPAPRPPRCPRPADVRIPPAIGRVADWALAWPPIVHLRAIVDAYNAAGGGLLAAGLAFGALFAV